MCSPKLGQKHGRFKLWALWIVRKIKSEQTGTSHELLNAEDDLNFTRVLDLRIYLA